MPCGKSSRAKSVESPRKLEKEKTERSLRKDSHDNEVNKHEWKNRKGRKSTSEAHPDLANNKKKKLQSKNEGISHQSKERGKTRAKFQEGDQWIQKEVDDEEQNEQFPELENVIPARINETNESKSWHKATLTWLRNSLWVNEMPTQVHY